MTENFLANRNYLSQESKWNLFLSLSMFSKKINTLKTKFKPVKLLEKVK